MFRFARKTFVHDVSTEFRLSYDGSRQQVIMVIFTNRAMFACCHNSTGIRSIRTLCRGGHHNQYLHVHADYLWQQPVKAFKTSKPNFSRSAFGHKMYTVLAVETRTLRRMVENSDHV